MHQSRFPAAPAVCAGALHDPDSHQQNVSLPPADAQPTDDEILASPDFKQFAKNALLLKVTRKDLPQTAKAQDQLRIQNDRIVAGLYGITGAELTHLLRSFKVMASKRPAYLTLLA